MRGDGFDLAELGALLESPGYRMIAERMQARRAGLLNELASAGSWEKTIRIQASIREIDIALGVPRQLAEEIKRKARA